MGESHAHTPARRPLTTDHCPQTTYNCSLLLTR